MREKTESPRPALAGPDPDEGLGSEAFRAIDRMREALSAKMTGGISPAAVALAYFDWSIHLAAAPGKRLELIDKAMRKTARLYAWLLMASMQPDTPACIEPLPGDSHLPRAQGPSFGASQRMVVAPGHESRGILQMPGGQSGHPLSPFWGSGHADWASGRPTPFLPGPEKHRLVLTPDSKL